MPQFDYCPPFEVYAGTVSVVKPLLETHSLRGALEYLRTRPNSNLTVRILVTEGQVSTLIPVRLRSADLDGKHGDDVRSFIESRAEHRFRSLVDGASRSATGTS